MKNSEHIINGEFQSDKHPELPADRIRINFLNPRSHRALALLAVDYFDIDPALAGDILERLATVWSEPGYSLRAATANIVPVEIHRDPDTGKLRLGTLP